MKCTECNIRLRRHLWVVNGIIYCSPQCERGGKQRADRHRYGDKQVKKYGIAGFVKGTK